MRKRKGSQLGLSAAESFPSSGAGWGVEGCCEVISVARAGPRLGRGTEWWCGLPLSDDLREWRRLEDWKISSGNKLIIIQLQEEELVFQLCRVYLTDGTQVAKKSANSQAFHK